MDTSTIIEGTVKFRDGKKWKSRWCVMRKLSPVADCLHLQLYRDSRDRYKQGLTKASLSLQHFLGLETGFTLDKESNTIAIICQDLIVVLAFDTRERLIQWQVKIYNHLGEDQQFLIQISSSPPKAKLSPGPARLHIQERRFCLTTGVPPKLAGCWEIKHLRRYGVVDGKFCFEGGSLCGRGEGLYVFLTDQGDEITRSVQVSSEGRLNSLRRPLLRNMSVQQESPRKSLTLRTETRLSEISCAESCFQMQGTLRPNDNIQPWPSMETQTDVYGHGDTTSLADFSIDSHSTKVCKWPGENQLGRCVSCIGKLGLISRPSTAANTPGSINFNPWSMDDSKLCLTGMHHASFLNESDYSCGDSSCMFVSQKSKYSNSSSSNTDCSDQPSSCQYSLLESAPKCFQIPISPPKSLQSNCNSVASYMRIDADSPPCRPPKPAKYRNYVDSTNHTPTKKKINKPPMPLPYEQNECSCKLVATPPLEQPQPLPPQFDNYDLPRLAELVTQRGTEFDSKNSQYYDTPRSIKVPAKDNIPPYANYDVPPAAVPLRNGCVCTSQIKITMERRESRNSDICFCHQLEGLFRHPPTWMPLPLHASCKNPVQNLGMPKSMEPSRIHSCKEAPVYAKIDLSKKTKNRLGKERPNERSVIPPQNANASNNYMNIRFEGEEENYKRLNHLNYMNLEFTNSLMNYVNVRELFDRDEQKERIDGLNIDLPAKMSNGHPCRKCGHTNIAKDSTATVLNHDKPKPKRISYLASTTTERNFENYVPMSPLKLSAVKLSPEKSASNPTLCESATVEKQRKTSLGPLGSKYSTLDSFSKHHAERRRSSSTNSPKVIKERARDTKSDDSASDSRPVDSDSGLESDKLSSQENDDTVENLRNRKENTLAGGLRRLSNVACKSSNRDSSSSNDSGFSSASLKYPCQDFTEFEMPLTTAGSAKRHNSFNQHCHKNGDRYSPLPRRTKSSDPLRDLSFQFLKGPSQPKSSSAEAELPLYLTKTDLYKDCSSPAETTVSVPYVGCRSTSSGTSDMSDYIETLSISSHSSSDVQSTDVMKIHQSVVTTLKPRSGNEYQKVDRASLLEVDAKID